MTISLFVHPILLAPKRFLLKVFDDLEERARPKATQRIAGHSLFADGKPIIHLIGSQGRDLDGAAEAFDHIGIHLDADNAFRAKLETLGVRYSVMDLPELDERRFFFAPLQVR